MKKKNEFMDFNEETSMKDLELCKDMKFNNENIFRNALREWAVRRGYSCVLVKNNRLRIIVVCKNKC